MYIGSTQGAFQKRYNNHRSSFTHEIYRNRTSLCNYMWEIKNKQGIDPLLKWEIIKKNCWKYKAGDRYWLLCIEEKLTIASYNNPNELLNQRSEILRACRHKKGLAPWQIECGLSFYFVFWWVGAFSFFLAANLIIKCLGQPSLVRIIWKIREVKPG